jgi:branched-subunit amino acid aminotransferase/4-amino-4-deoxychorismate lyase
VKRTVWLSGRYLPEERAKVPATSSTLSLGIGLYETLRLVDSRAPLLDLHLERLCTSCKAVGLPLAHEPWDAILAGLALRNRIRNGRARITIGDRFRLATCARLPRGLEQEREKGISLTTVRWQRPGAGLKDISRMSLWLAERSTEAEVLLLSPHGRALETSRSNLFVLTENGLQTAPTPDVLPGIARGLVVELAGELGIPVRFRAPALREPPRWKEAFVTNALRGVRPVVDIDGRRLRRAGGRSVMRALQRGLDRRMQLR